MKLNKEKTYQKPSLTIVEKRELNMMRSDIVCLEAMYQEGAISLQDYNRRLNEISERIMILEEKYGLR